MSEPFVLDNDIALKACCYDCTEEFAATCCASRKALILATAPFVLRDRIARSSRIKNRARASQALGALLTRLAPAEPTDDELALAAELEETATQRNLELDTGESILFAILSLSGARALLTGDKRAVSALEVASEILGVSKADGRIACFEQVMSTLLQQGGPVLAAKVCAEPDVDKALAICFRCTSGSFDAASAQAGLASYVADLRKSAPRLLSIGDSLQALVAHENGVG